jgi:hypothetical protein
MSVAKLHPRGSRAEPGRFFTTSFPLAFLRELAQAAKETGPRKNEILIQAFTAWIKEYKQARLAESYRRGTW